jgi:hypothetical protein
MEPAKIDDAVAEAVLAIDTLWGGDVMAPSGTGRFIADSWFSDRSLPLAYTHETAGAVRAAGGVTANEPDREALAAYIAAVDPQRRIDVLEDVVRGLTGSRGQYLRNLHRSLEVMWRLVRERLGEGDPVPYDECVEASTGAAPRPSDASAKRATVERLLADAGYGAENDLRAAVSAWRGERMVPAKSLPMLAQAYIAQLDGLARDNVMPHLPDVLAEVPRANITFLPIADAWFSGSMNYIGRARRPDGTPEYEATYEINAALEISTPELLGLVSHEVVPGHVTTFAFLQLLNRLGLVGFEATVLTMNTQFATLAEGIANNAVLMAWGVREVEALPDPDLQIGTWLALLQDDAKNQASYLTYVAGRDVPEIATELLSDYLVSEERAAKLSGAWAQHPLLGRMYLPAYRAGTERVAELRRSHPDDQVLPVVYGCRGVVDQSTVLDRVGEATS